MRKSERVPKKQYFQERLEYAKEHGLKNKAAYFQERLDELNNQKFTKDDLIEIEQSCLFGDRDTMGDAMKYAESFNDIHVTTAVMVMINTIAKNYYLMPKDKVDQTEEV